MGESFVTGDWWHRLGTRLAILSLAVLASAPEAKAQFVRFERHGTAQGLGNLAVETINQDIDGSLLVGTEGGLYRFDGASFQPYTDPALPPAAWIHQLAFDTAHRLWISSGDGVFVRNHGALIRVARPKQVNDQIGSHTMAPLGAAMAVDVDGVVTIIDVPANGKPQLSPLFDAAATARIPGLSEPHFVVSSGDGTILIGCGHQVCVANGKDVAILGAADGLPDEAWLAALRGADGTVWLRSLRHLAWRKPGESRFSTVEIAGDLQSYFVGRPGDIDLAEDGRGDIFTESDRGLIEWNGHAWRIFAAHAGGLPEGITHSVFFDREGSLWVGSEGGGVSRSLGLGAWEHWTADDGLPSNIVWSMAERSDGGLWVATDTGTVLLRGPQTRRPGGDYALTLSHQGRLWLAPVDHDLQRLAPDGLGVPEHFPAVPGALHAAVDRANRLWISTRTGIVVVDDADAPASFIHPRRVVEGSQFVVALDPAGALWAINRSQLLRERPDGTLAQIALPAGWNDHPSDLTFAKDGTLWVGTEAAGVRRFRVDRDRVVELPGLQAPELPSNSVLFVHCDRRGWLWIGTDHGIELYAGQKRWRFDGTDGPLSDDIDQAAVFEDHDGSMWFGTSAGLSHLTNPLAHGPAPALHPHVTSITYGEHGATAGQALLAPWTSAPLLIRVDDYDFATGPLVFRYRLRGVDKRWTETSSRDIRYASVPGGHLTFEVVAIDQGHAVRSPVVSVTVEIRPPWWRQWWFYLSVSLAAVAVLAATWRARIGFLVRQREQLEELVRCRTAEIAAANEQLAQQSAREQRRLEEMVKARTTEIELARQELQRLALSDALTGLPNRRAVLSQLETWIAAPRPPGHGVAALLLDVDHFKQVNDRHGHVAGDEVLTQYGARLAATVRLDDVAGRYGGEEFLVILRGREEAVVQRARAIWEAVSAGDYVVAGQARAITTSAGLAMLRPNDTDLSLIERADAALYRAKEAGRSRLEVASNAELPSEALQETGTALPRPDLTSQLRGALAAGEFTLVFQPIVDVRQGIVTSCEALLRWQSPALGQIPPSVFVPLAQDIGIMPELGAWVLQQACRQAATWPAGVGVSVNLSPSQLADSRLVERVSDALRDSHLPANRLELEVTESAMIGDVLAARRVLNELRALGLSVALDDFGTGFSSLSFLQTLPFDRIKIDKSFVMDLGSSSRSLAIIRSLVSLCRGLGAKITAEGVETEAQVETLLEAGCSELQGYLFARPCNVEQLREWMAAMSSRSVEPADTVIARLRHGLRQRGELAEPPL